MKNKTNLLIDFSTLAAFLVAMEPHFTGVNLHEWLSVGLGIGVFVHILLHWDWIIHVGGAYFKNLWHTSRLNFFLDVLWFLSFNTVLFSGLMISRSLLPALGITGTPGGTWRIIHAQSAAISMWLVAIHFGLHWKWIWSMVKRFVFSPIARVFKPKPSVPAMTSEMSSEK